MILYHVSYYLSYGLIGLVERNTGLNEGRVVVAVCLPAPTMASPELSAAFFFFTRSLPPPRLLFFILWYDCILNKFNGIIK